MQEFDYSDENIKKTIEQDYFSRNRYLLRLIELIDNSNECSMFAVDGRWGSGKTVFMHQLMHCLSDRDMYVSLCKKYTMGARDTSKIESYYFNAWENDLINNPILNLFNGLTDEYLLFSSADKAKYNHIIKLLEDVSCKILSGGLLSREILQIGGDNPYSSILEIKKNISEIIGIIKRTKQVNKVVIIIDELDRCKPNYAVELLETLKHFYDSEDVLFIVSTDLVQLAHSVRNLYGNGFDGDLYLERFFKGIFTLNSPSYEKYIETELEYFISATHILHDCCKLIINHYDLSVREVSKFIKQIKLLEDDIELARVNPYYLLAKRLFVPLGIGLKYKSNSMFNSFKNGKFSKNEFEELYNANTTVLEWLMECVYDGQVPQELNVIDEIFDLYHFIFSDNKVKYDLLSSEKDKFRSINKEYIKSLIDF